LCTVKAVVDWLSIVQSPCCIWHRNVWNAGYGMHAGVWFWSEQACSSERLKSEHLRRSDNCFAWPQRCRQDYYYVFTHRLLGCTSNDSIAVFAMMSANAYEIVLDLEKADRDVERASQGDAVFDSLSEMAVCLYLQDCKSVCGIMVNRQTDSQHTHKHCSNSVYD